MASLLIYLSTCRLIDSATKPGFSKAQLVEEQTKILQITADIKSIERELSVLSAAKTDAGHRKQTENDSSGAPTQFSDRSIRVADDSSKSLSGVRKNLMSAYFEVASLRAFENEAGDQKKLPATENSTQCAVLTNRPGKSPPVCFANHAPALAGCLPDNCTDRIEAIPPKIAEESEDIILNHEGGCEGGEEVDLAR